MDAVSGLFRSERRLLARRAAIAVALLAAAIWAANGTQFRPWGLVTGAPAMADLIGRMLPPSLSTFPGLLKPLRETLEMAILGTTLPIAVALPLALFAAGNTGLSRVLGSIARLILNFLRTIPDVLWALLIVSAVGLGPVGGILAMTIHSIGGLGKFYYEAFESVDPDLLDGMKAVGATRFQTIWFGVLPASMPLLMSSTLTYWEFNNRAATVLGLVGAGGIGLAITHAFQDFRYPDALMAIVLVVATLTAIDRLSAAWRRKLIQG